MDLSRIRSIREARTVRVRQFLVKWKDIEEPTWVDEDRLLPTRNQLTVPHKEAAHLELTQSDLHETSACDDNAPSTILIFYTVTNRAGFAINSR